MTLRPTLTLAAALLAGACAATRAPDALHVMRLAPRPAPVAMGSAVVALGPVSAPGLAGGRRYLYVDRVEPAELRQAASFVWDVPPATVLEQAVRAALGPAAATPRAAELAGARGRGLALRLTRFEEATGGGADTSAEVGVEATLVDAAGVRILFARAYCARAPITASGPSARARAFEAAVSELAARLAQDAGTGLPSASAC